MEERKMDKPKVTKCPPGEAIGARDLQNWASRRSIGRSGVSPKGTEKERQRWGKVKMRFAPANGAWVKATAEFWIAWKNHKREMIELGYSAKKSDDGVWLIRFNPRASSIS